MIPEPSPPAPARRALPLLGADAPPVDAPPVDAHPVDAPAVAAEPATDWLYAAEPESPLRLRLARQAQRGWADLGVQGRARRLLHAVDVMTARMEEIVDVIVAENGKPRVEAIGHEVGSAIANLRWLCARAPELLGSKSVPLKWMPNRSCEVSLEAFGVVLVISPWNFPFSIPFGQVVAALVAGNAVVLKPSEETPLVGDLIASVLAECGLPQNVFTVVQGDGAAGAALVDARPDKIFFTGSVATGRAVMRAAAAHPVPVCLELGGIDALVVCDDADLELAASAAAWGATFNGGQVCASVERLLVHESVSQRFSDLLTHKLAQIDAGRDMGTITADKQKLVYDRHLEDTKAHDVTALAGGAYESERRLRPTLIVGKDIESSAVWREETFGPVVAMATFRNDDEAIRKHNDSHFGLTASVFSRSRSRATRLAEGLRVGLVSINDVAATLHAFGELPWGGVGESGFGRSHGTEGLLEFVRPKVVERTRRFLPEFKRPWWFPYGPQQQELMGLFVKATATRSTRERVALLAKVGARAARLLVDTPRL